MAPNVRGGGGGGNVPLAPAVNAGAGAPRFSFHHLEVTLISAQDLYPSSRSMRTYAVAYLGPGHRVRTRVDTAGHIDPNWNEKFVFRVDDAILRSDTAALTVDVFAERSGLFPSPDPHLGTARALISTLRPASATHFAALQVRRPTSLRPQGILNLSAALVDPYNRPAAPHAPKPEAHNHKPKPKRRTPGKTRPPPPPPDHLRERPELDHKRHHPAPTRPELEPPKRHNPGPSRLADREKTDLEKQLEKWKSEIPAVSGEVVKLDKGGRGGAPLPPPGNNRALGQLQGRRSFRRMACLGGEELESSEYVGVPRIMPDRPAKRGAHVDGY